MRWTIAGREEEVQLSCDRAIIGSGHDWGGSRRPDGVVLPNPWTGLIDAPHIGPRIAILGTSLSGIDAVVTVAGRIGSFFNLSPETDFYFPLPYEACGVQTSAAVAVCMSQGRDGILERLFDLFPAKIAAADSTFALNLRGATSRVEMIFDAMSAPRRASDPFDWARADFARSIADSGAHHTIPWQGQAALMCCRR